jgi:hypothetical protein
MSFLTHSQRGYEHVSHQLSVQNQNRLHQMPTSPPPPSPSYDDYPPQSVPPQPPQIQSSANAVFDHASSSGNLPKVGETRCCAWSNDRVSIILHIYPDFHPFSLDWSLLSSDLQFIYMDPVFASHLEDQADALVGKSLLAFIHPDEQASAKHDLGNVLESRTLHGSVTRSVFILNSLGQSKNS